MTIDNCAYDLHQKDLGANSSRDCLKAQNLKKPPPMQKGIISGEYVQVK